MTWQLTKKHSFDTVFDAQKVFRLVLEAISHPAEVVNIKESADKLFGNCPQFLALAMTLLDNETSFSVYGDDSLYDDIASLTLARREKPESADFIFVYDPSKTRNAIESAKCGTLSDPHKSATVVIRNGGGSVCSMRLAGPGIETSVEILASPTVKAALSCRDEQDYEYPQGIDLIFISENGELIAVPRLVKVVE